MPRFEYIDHEGNAHVVTAESLAVAIHKAWWREMDRTVNMRLADMAAGTVEQSDERSRAA